MIDSWTKEGQKRRQMDQTTSLMGPGEQGHLVVLWFDVFWDYVAKISSSISALLGRSTSRHLAVPSQRGGHELLQWSAPIARSRQHAVGYGAGMCQLGNGNWLLVTTLDSVRPWIWWHQVANIPMALLPTPLRIWGVCQWMGLIARSWFLRARLRIQSQTFVTEEWIRVSDSEYSQISKAMRQVSIYASSKVSDWARGPSFNGGPDTPVRSEPHDRKWILTAIFRLNFKWLIVPPYATLNWFDNI